MIGSVCDSSYPFYLKKFLTELDISPRKILNRGPDMFLDSPTKLEGSMFQKFLPYNNVDDDEDDDPYSAEHFRMYEFKVRRCTRSRSHDWTDCPFAHPGEKARRRDPRKFHYSGTVCSEFRKGKCSRGDNCEFAHGVFESWLHPARYRTEACKDGKNCKRKVCFFAHSPRQLRILPVNNRYVSPPQSPAKTGVCYGMTAAQAQLEAVAIMSYKDALTELVNSLEAMKVKHVSNPLSTRYMNIPLVNANIANGVDQTPLSLSPSTPVGHSYGSTFLSAQRNNTLFDGGDGKNNNINDGGLTGIDLGWVNDLLT